MLPAGRNMLNAGDVTRNRLTSSIDLPSTLAMRVLGLSWLKAASLRITLGSQSLGVLQSPAP